MMTNKSKLLVMAIIPVMIMPLVRCGPPPAAKEYTHTTSGFKFTAAAGWNLVDQDSERYEFRLGNYKLVEVAGFDLELKPSDLAELDDELTGALLKESTMGGLEGYCEEARIKNYNITEEGPTTWGGLPGYQIKARGYSEEVTDNVAVDIIVAVVKSKARMYMLASQILESDYTKTEPDLLQMISSFQLLP
jgi:hypothetical protein